MRKGTKIALGTLALALTSFGAGNAMSADAQVDAARLRNELKEARSGLVCWQEPNDRMASGKEKICGTVEALVRSMNRMTEEVAGFKQTITEDDPRWDCRTMGNRICGPTQASTPDVPGETPESVKAQMEADAQASWLVDTASDGCAIDEDC